jgi:small subunit ribosomal protein S20
MPHHKSTIKRLRQNVKERAYNRAVRTRTRALVKTARAAEGADAKSALTSAYAGLDRAVKLGVVPKRRAARLKSRLAKRANAAS